MKGDAIAIPAAQCTTQARAGCTMMGVHKLAETVARYVRQQQLLAPGNRVGVAVSGGADSVALFRLLLELKKELGLVLSVAHFNHKLRGEESDQDEQFVAELAKRHKVRLLSDSGDVGAHAATQHLSLEAAAREMRYAFFRRLFEEGAVDDVATAHTLDDQAETVLMRVVRGAGTKGLAGIYPRLRTSDVELPAKSSIIRPLLGVRRKELENYLKEIGQDWREDSSNRDLRHARNRVRHGILPRLERNLNPAVREALAETAEIARAEEEFWGQEVARIVPQISDGRRDAGATLNIARLHELPLALRRRVVRAVADSEGLRLEFRQVEEILEVAAGKGIAAELAGDWVVSRKRGVLAFERGIPGVPEADYEYALAVPGKVAVPEAGTILEIVLVPGKLGAGYNPEHSFDPNLLGKELRVRNWRAGDRFWPAHTKRARKVKELLQDRRVTGRERKLWPVMVSGESIIWLRGFPSPANLRPRDDEQAAVIREMPLET